MIKDDFIKAVFDSHFFLFRLGYRMVGPFDAAREFGITFQSKVANRNITIMWADDDELTTIFQRHYKSLRAVLLLDSDPRLFCELRRDLPSFPAFLSLPRHLTEANYTEVLKENARFLKEHLMPVIKGEQWCKGGAPSRRRVLPCSREEARPVTFKWLVLRIKP